MLASQSSQKNPDNQSREEKQKAYHRAYLSKISNSLCNLSSEIEIITFVIHFGYAIENVWITMLMITNKTPNIIDTFVWIIPVLIAIFIRPHVIYYIHQKQLKIYRQIKVICWLLWIGALGSLFVANSCVHNQKNIFKRIFFCSLGWTIMDVCFELILYITNKVEEKIAIELEDKIKETKQISFIRKLLGENIYQFFGLFLGYCTGILIGYMFIKNNIKGFYVSSKIMYFCVTALAFFAGFRLYLKLKMTFPPQQESQQISVKKNKSSQFLTDPVFYLPGLIQLGYTNFKTYSLLLLHFSIVFINDVIVIYATMWLSQPSNADFSKKGEAHANGIIYGSFYLIIYTIVNNINISFKIFQSFYTFNLFLITLLLNSLGTFYFYNSHSFLILIINISLINHTYKKVVFDNQIQTNTVFQRCIQIIERFEKIFVLCIMPFITLLILKRDDIPDSLIFTAIMAILGLISYQIGLVSIKLTKNKKQKPIVKVQKIE